MSRPQLLGHSRAVRKPVAVVCFFSEPFSPLYDPVAFPASIFIFKENECYPAQVPRTETSPSREDLALPGLLGSHPSVCCVAIKPSGRDLSWT